MINYYSEGELKAFFETETASVSPSPVWWQQAVSNAVACHQEPRPNGSFFAKIFTLFKFDKQKPLLSITTYLLLLIMSGSVAGILLYDPKLGSVAPPPTATSLPPTIIVLAMPTSENLTSVILMVILGLLALATLLIILWVRLKRKNSDP